MHFEATKILVATDFSSYSRAAADAGVGLARKLGGPLTLLHVTPISVYADAVTHLEGSIFSTQDLRTSVQKRVAQEAEREVARLQVAGISAVFVSADGPPAAEIARVAREGQFDLVVIGTHGRTGLRHLALGSVAENVVRLSSVPVLVMPLEGSPEP